MTSTAANTVTVDLEKRLDALLAVDGLRLDYTYETRPLIRETIAQLREYRTALEARPAMPEREAIARIICEETMCPWDSGTTNYVAEYRPTPESREQIRAYRAADAILSLTGDVREAAPERENHHG